MSALIQSKVLIENLDVVVFDINGSRYFRIHTNVAEKTVHCFNSDRNGSVSFPAILETKGTIEEATADLQRFLTNGGS